MSSFDGKAFGQEIVAAVKAYVGPVEARCAELERRLAEVEAKALHYEGVFQRACDYGRGSATTHDGALFVAVRDVKAGEIPGKSDGWQLAAKSAARPA